MMDDILILVLLAVIFCTGAISGHIATSDSIQKDCLIKQEAVIDGTKFKCELIKE